MKNESLVSKVINANPILAGQLTCPNNNESTMSNKKCLYNEGKINHGDLFWCVTNQRDTTSSSYESNRNLNSDFV